MPRMLPQVLALASMSFASAFASTARADTHVVAPAGGGLAPLDVKVSLADGTVDAGGMRMHIELDRAQLPAEKDVTVAFARHLRQELDLADTALAHAPVELLDLQILRIDPIYR